MIALNRCLQPPADSFVPQGAALYCNLASSRSGETVRITYRFVETEAGTTHDQQETFTVPIEATTEYTIKANMPECFLIGVSVLSVTAEQRGETFVRVMLKAKDGKHLTTFLRGYVTKSEGLSYPPITLESSLSGRGASKEAYLSDVIPCAFVLTIKKLWIVKSVHFVLTTSAVEADRIVCVELVNQTGVVLSRIVAAETQPASTTQEYSFITGGESRKLLRSGSPDVTYVLTNIGHIEVANAYGLLVNVLDTQAGDVAVDCWLVYEELLAPDMPIYSG